MKKLLILLFAAFCAVSASAQLKASEKSFLNRVKTYIADEGYRPEIDEDEDVIFKKEGTIYWVRVREEDGGYFYVTFNHASVNCEDARLSAVRKAANEVTKDYKVGKAYYNETNEEVRLTIEGFYKTAGDFTHFFPRYISILDNMDEDLKELYEKYTE